MSAFNGVPYAGPLQISIEDCKDDLIDLPDGALRYLRNAKPGIESVRAELEKSIPTYGEQVGVSSGLHQRFVSDCDAIDKLQEHEATLAKALEVVRETLAKKQHDRENAVSQIVDSVKSSAQRTGNEALIAPFQKTIEYSAQYAVKAAETRRKNAKMKIIVQ